MAHDTVDVIVIGAGVVGTSIALELSRGGRSVTVVDRSGGVGHGSTSASSGIVRFHYSTHAGVALSWEAARGWLDWAGHLGCADSAGLAGFQQTGMLVLEPVPGSYDRITTLYDAVGVAWERWDAAAIQQRVPGLDTGRFGPPAPVHSDAFFAEPSGSVGGLFTPDAGYVPDPQLAADNLAAAARRHGAEVRLRTEVVAIRPEGPRRWQVTTANGDALAADIVVNAAGPWSTRVNEIAGIGGDFSVTSRPLRQEVHEVSTPEGFAADGGQGMAIADPDLGIYARPSGPGKVIIGGMEPECDPLEWLDDPDAVVAHATQPVYEAQLMRAARRFPALAVPNRPTGIAGVYDATTDWTPIYDRAAPGFYVAMGTSGNQFKNAPVIGLVMRRLIDEIEGGRDHDRDPVRVELPRTGNVVDLSAYSRRREVDASAPSSVLG